jgi:zinc protease
MRRLVILTAAVLVAAMAFPLTAVAEGKTVPSRPEELTFDELRFEVPPGDGYRHVLKNGVPVYVAEDRALPLVNISISLRGGDYLDPADKVGLATLTATMIRQGGTTRLNADELNEKVEFLAAQMSTFARPTQIGARFNSISPVLDESLALFFEILRTPGFQEDRLAVEKENALERMKQRNDNASTIQRREWEWLLHGEDFYNGREMTSAHLEAITREDLVAFHGRYFRPENMIISVSGDVTTKDILAQLEAELAKWEGKAEDVPWPPPLPTHKPKPGLYHVEKDIPQGKVLIGHLTRQWNDWDDPDRPAVSVMNFILGGSGFTSRIMQKVRSDEGLAYGAGSRFAMTSFYPGIFSVTYASKNPTVALAAKYALAEVSRIQAEPVTKEELELAKASLVDTFPRRFESASRIVATYASDAYAGRSHDYWQKWRDRIDAVTVKDVQRVAKQYLKSDEMVFLVVGKWDEIVIGDADKRASMIEFFGGEVQRLPLRDPLTLKPMP